MTDKKECPKCGSMELFSEGKKKRRAYQEINGRDYTLFDEWYRNKKCLNDRCNHSWQIVVSRQGYGWKTTEDCNKLAESDSIKKEYRDMPLKDNRKIYANSIRFRAKIVNNGNYVKRYYIEIPDRFNTFIERFDPIGHYLNITVEEQWG